jgi:DNA-binding phage protein
MAAKRRDKADLDAALRAAIAASGLNRKQIADRAGIGYAAIHGYMGGTRDLTITTVTRILRGLGLRVEIKPTRRRKA